MCETVGVDDRYAYTVATGAAGVGTGAAGVSSFLTSGSTAGVARCLLAQSIFLSGMIE